MLNVTWNDVYFEADLIAARWRGRDVTSVVGIPQGGAVPAVLVAQMLGVPLRSTPESGSLIVDDLIDSGATMQPYVDLGYNVDALYRKPHSPAQIASQATLVDDWLAFPWEKDAGAPTDGIIRLIEYIGEDPTREGLLDTPKRVLKAFKEMTEGYHLNPADILGTTFDVGDVDEMVVVRNIEFVSLCEHHMLPFTGTAAVAYIPKDRVVGLSKIARLIDLYARRLQVQERFTRQITTALDEHLNPKGSACVIEAAHACMGCRGVRKPSARMVTSSLTGMFRQHEVRAEFLSLAD